MTPNRGPDRAASLLSPTPQTHFLSEPPQAALAPSGVYPVPPASTPSPRPSPTLPALDPVCSPTPVAPALPSGPHSSRLTCFPQTRSSRGKAQRASPHPTWTGTKGCSGHAAGGPPRLCTRTAAHAEVASRQKTCFSPPPLHQLAHCWHQGRERAPSILIPHSLPSSPSLPRARVLLGPPPELAAGRALFLGE